MADINSRMNRLVGQIEGIRRMINSGRNSGDVVQQILASREALSKIALIVLKEEIIKSTEKGVKNEKNTSHVSSMLEKIFRV